MKKVVIITGGIKGIGLGIATGFLDAGYQVVLNYRSDHAAAKKALEAFTSKDVMAIQADITCKDDRDKLIIETQNKFGRLDVLVNNAGIIRNGRLLDISEENLSAIMQNNLLAPILLSQLFANALIKNKHTGSIINVLSTGAYNPGNLAYCTSKAGLHMATRCMAAELAKYGIRVNSISPGFVITELNQQNLESKPDQLEKMIHNIPIKRAAEPSEMAGAVLFLASDAASYITGTDIVVDGGRLQKS